MTDYANRVKDILQRDYFDKNEGWIVQTIDARKNNGVVLSGISIRKEGEKASPTFYVDGYKQDGFSEEATAESIYQEYRKHLKENKTMNENALLDKLSSFPDIRDYICYKLINRKANQELFENVPYLDVNDDLSVVYYLQIARGATAIISNQMLDIWKVEKENADTFLWKIAEKNTIKQNPPELRSMISILTEGMSYEEKDALGFDVMDGIEKMYVLTNKNKIFGASTLLYNNGKILQDCMKQIEEKTGTEYKGIYILPSSIHEVIIFPDDGTMNKEELMQTVQEVNRTQFTPQQVLSDNVFYYDDESGFQQLTYTQMELTR